MGRTLHPRRLRVRPPEIGQVALRASATWPPEAGPRARLWYDLSMALLARPAALAALALALAPAAARADTTNIVFPVAGPVIHWKDDYGTVSGGTRQAATRSASRRGRPSWPRRPGGCGCCGAAAAAGASR